MTSWLKNSRCLCALLAASVALNVVLVGFYAGSVLFTRKPTHEHVMNARIEGLTTLLPRQSRGDMEKALNKANRSVKEKYGAMNAERAHIQELLSGRTIDTNEVDQSFARLRTLHADSQKIYQDAFTQAVAALPYQQRRHIHRKFVQRHPSDATKKTRKDQENAESND